LGETSLERKCRFLFGGGLMLLITGSFYIYGRLTQDLVYQQNISIGRSLSSLCFAQKHWEASQFSPEFAARIKKMLPKAEQAKDSKTELMTANIEEMTREVKPAELQDYSWSMFSDMPTADGSKRTSDFLSEEALAQLRESGKNEYIHQRQKVENKNGVEYQYFRALRASSSCIECHYH